MQCLYVESFYASQEIIYKKMEGVDTVPETAWVQVKDRTTGRKTKRILPLEQFSRFHEHWEDGLEITIEQEKEFQNEITEAEILDEAVYPLRTMRSHRSRKEKMENWLPGAEKRYLTAGQYTVG